MRLFLLITILWNHGGTGVGVMQYPFRATGYPNREKCCVHAAQFSSSLRTIDPEQNITDAVMPPNSVNAESSFPPLSSVVSLEEHFWTCDKQGMDKLVSKIKQSYDTLDDILALYNQRALFEREYGQNLLKLNKKATARDEQGQEDNGAANTTTASTQAIQTVYLEIVKSAQSHIDMAGRLEQEVAGPLKEWITTHRGELDKLVDALDTIYDDRQKKVKQLVLVREQYQMQSGRQPSSISSDYQSAVDAADKAVREWNIAWIKACQQMEVFEHERMDILTSNVWDYANLCSARLLVQDEWSEKIRSQLETCTIEEELVHCIENLGTSIGSSTAPTTSDYVEFFAKKFKQEAVHNKRLPPRPRTMSSTATTMVKQPAVASINKPNEQQTAKCNSMMVKRKPLATSDMGLDALLKKFESSNTLTNNNNGTSIGSSGNSNSSGSNSSRSGLQKRYDDRPTTEKHTQIQPAQHHEREDRAIPQPSTSTTTMEHSAHHQQQQQQMINRSAHPKRDDRAVDSLQATMTNARSVHQYQKKQRDERPLPPPVDRFQTASTSKKRDNRPPLEPNQTQAPAPSSSSSSSSSSSQQPRGSMANDNQQAIIPMQQQHQQQPPKSPRPQPQQLQDSRSPSMKPSTSTATTGTLPSNVHNSMTPPRQSSIATAPYSPVNMHPPHSPAMVPVSQPPSSFSQPHPSPQSNMMAPPHSPMMMAAGGSAAPSPLHSPAMTHQPLPPPLNMMHSPAMQPTTLAMTTGPSMMAAPHSPMMAPSSPAMMTTHMHSPAPHYTYPQPASPMAAPHSPNIPPSNANGSSPWPASSPYYYNNNNNNNNSKPTNSPLMMPTGSSLATTPQAAAPHADDHHQQQQLPDGRPIMFWVRAKYDYLANEETEISFKRGSLFAVVGMSQDEGWWNAVLWDETWHCTRGLGCIPSNYIEIMA
ncbi:hypothetical protein BDB00DRAFT_192918 [Zychaea mexicana]|uniref:uncharacterized protein n=1 Tax=Zychaea mexicana TaxID=64656 RepID=UPI0022FF443E|nr:uncharacterized protein BDB00DRAFT_192918 [Zychaea mexicana]KAI9495779.1 hypothetical protein BDB00DRAFT_192918 [Zychaea mexicana]